MTDEVYRERRRRGLERARAWRKGVRLIERSRLDREVKAMLLYWGENELRNRKVDLYVLRRQRPELP